MYRLQFAQFFAFAVLAASAPAFADVIFTDGTFAPANYTQAGLYQSGMTITSSQCATCGKPNFALQFMEANAGNAALGLINTTFSYDPSTQGAILSINASVDKLISTTITGSFGNTFHPTIEQDGNYYLASIPGPSFVGPGTEGFDTISQSGLVAADFLQYDFTTGTFGTGTPNFAGDAMLFGLTQISSTTASGTFTFTQVYDNLSVDLATVPETSSVWLLITVLPLVALSLRRRTSRLG